MRAACCTVARATCQAARAPLGVRGRARHDGAVDRAGAWAQARAATGQEARGEGDKDRMPSLMERDDAGSVVVRELESNADLSRVPPFEQRIWNNPDPVPASLMRVWADHGGAVWVAAPAHAPDSWVGFAAAFPARDAKGWYLHSHGAGVLGPWRSRGIGRRLKERQRAWARDAGYRRIGWTFDPLRAQNARFNLHYLNARVTGYLQDYYGVLDSPITRGYPTDRLFVEWDVDPGGPEAPCGADERTIPVPEDIEAVLRQDPRQVLRILLDVRARFTELLAGGWTATDFRGSAYVLSAPGGVGGDPKAQGGGRGA
jgi:predicted GNAT superfamily acetyltransferase